MAFPVSPSNGQIATVNGIRYVYNATVRSWTRISNAKFTAAAGAPSNPALGDEWYNTNLDILFQYVNDGTSSYWVDIQSLGQTGNITALGDSTLQGNVVVGVNNRYSIGASNGYVANVFANTVVGNTAQITTLTSANNTVILSGNIIPSANVTFDLGSSNFRFRDLWLSGNTIYFGGAFLTSDSSNVTIANPAGGSFTVSGTSPGSGNVAFGNITFNGSGNRIRGDFSNSTLQNRTLIQTSTTNDGTSLSIIPNGSPGSNQSNYAVFNGSDINNSAYVLMGITNSIVTLGTGQTGTGTALPLSIIVGGSERARFNTTGAFIFAGGTTTADGIGIAFPAVQSASTDANTLDDYEEGTFTPTAGGTITPGTGTYLSQTGRYTKIGRVCFFQLTIGWSNITGSLGSMAIYGLPFVSESGQAGQSAAVIGYNSNFAYTNDPKLYIVAGNSYMVFNQSTTAGSVSQIPVDTAVSELIISGHYITQ